MLFVLSPAKALDYETPVAPEVPHTQPLFGKQSAALIAVLREKSPQQIAELMKLSDQLGGLDAASLTPAQLDWLQDHMCILSGLYGVLRPLDWMQPYRLEMGTRLKTDQGANLYQFWGTQIADYLNQRLAGDKAPILVNLASQEYFKSVDRKVLQARVIDCVFEDYKGGQYKVISFLAKRARGLMARYAAQHKVATPKKLEGFDLEGYAFAPAASEPDRLVFRRKR